MTEHRVERLQEFIKEELGEIIQRELKDPRIGFASITAVKVSNDKSHVKIYVSVMGDEEQKRETMKGLESAKGFMRTEIGKRVRLRHTPELEILPDSSLEEGARIISLLNQIHDQEGNK
ncbi:MAG TPA: 30S ribosome-binding factor RbfA [Bacillota bacterium]|nr:30S ribosome-binding factor RbfA [Bacillota bacterium]